MARAPSSYNQCLTAVETAAGRDLKESELERIFDALQGKVRRYTATGMSEMDAYVRAGRELGDDMRLAGVIEKRNKIINAIRRRELDARLVDGKEAVNLRAVMMETDAKAAGVTAELMGPFVARLEAAGLRKLLARGDEAFERDVWRELDAIGKGGGGAATRNAPAREAAKIIADFQERARVMQNEAGAWIGKREDYITRQVHDQDKIERAGFEAWRDYIAPRLDPRTYDGLDSLTPEAVDGFLLRVYNALKTGVHDTPSGRVAWGDVGAGTGPANLAKRVSAQRTLVFRDADARADYHAQFGRGNLMNTVVSSLETAARNTALMRDWGPNPTAMHDTVVQQAMTRAKNRGDADAVKALQNTFDNKIFAALTGDLLADAGDRVLKTRSWQPDWLNRLTYGTIGAWGQAIQTLSKLGGVTLSSVPDLAVNAAVLRHNGIPLFESYGNQLRALMPKGAAAKETAQLSGAGIDGILGSVASRVHAMDVGRGTPTRLVELFHKANFLAWWTDSLKSGIATMLTHNMGRIATTGFDALDPMLKHTMGRYGITAADWDIARATARNAPDGRLHLLPAHIDDAVVRSKFFTYVANQVRDAMNEPDAYVKAFMSGGTQAGTAMGTAVRLITQFKSYPVTFMRRTYLREFNSKDGVDTAGLAHLIVASTFLGYAAMEMKNIAKGRDTRTSNADSPGDYAKIVFAAMQQGGGFGLYGDFLFGDTSRMGSGPVVSLFGPTVGTADDLARQILTLRKWVLEGDERAGRDARSGALGLVRDNAPFVNLFYARAALDYFVWYRLQEAMNPGYLARYEERMRRENDTTFLISPTASPYRAMGLTP